MIGSTISQMADAEKLSPQQLQLAIQHGTVPSYIGIPLLQEKMKQSQEARALAAGQQKPPTIAQQVMQQAQAQHGVEGLPSGLPAENMAGGGIVAFADGGLYDDEDTDEDRIDAVREQEINDLMDEYAQAFQGGIGQLPATQAAESKGEDAADFIARIMHKESRGKRYDKEGNLLTSEKGAMGEMQVMPGTVRDPGFGIKAAQGNHPDEFARVGREYAQVMLDRYKDPKIAAIAYNWGPGNTDKWLAAGADPSKLPRETQGYIKGFAGGGDVGDDYSTIEGLEPSDLYAEAIKRAKAERAQESAVEEQPTKTGLWPYNAPEAGKFSYTDAAKFDARKRDEEPKAAPTSKPGITYAPNTGIGNVTPTRYVPKETNERESEMMRAVKTPFRAIGAGLESLYGGKVGMPSDTDYTASGDLAGAIMGERTGPAAKVNQAAAAQGLPSIARGRPTMAADPRLIGAQQPATRVSPYDTEDARVAEAIKPVAAQMAAAEKVDPYQEFKDIFKRREENLVKQREQDKYMALLSAGLGMMSGTSPNAFANIGTGAQQGLASLIAANKDRTAEENALLSGRLGLAKIGTAKEQADAMMQLRKDLATKADERARELAAANLEEKQIRREEGSQAKSLQRLTDISKNAEIQAEKAISANPAINFAQDREAKKQAMIADILRRNAAYAKTYRAVHGPDADPFEGLGQTGGGGTRIKFDAKGNMIQ